MVLVSLVLLLASAAVYGSNAGSSWHAVQDNDLTSLLQVKSATKVSSERKGGSRSVSSAGRRRRKSKVSVSYGSRRRGRKSIVSSGRKGGSRSVSSPGRRRRKGKVSVSYGSRRRGRKSTAPSPSYDFRRQSIVSSGRKGGSYDVRRRSITPPAYSDVRRRSITVPAYSGSSPGRFASPGAADIVTRTVVSRYPYVEQVKIHEDDNIFHSLMYKDAIDRNARYAYENGVEEQHRISDSLWETWEARHGDDDCGPACMAAIGTWWRSIQVLWGTGKRDADVLAANLQRDLLTNASFKEQMGNLTDANVDRDAAQFISVWQNILSQGFSAASFHAAFGNWFQDVRNKWATAERDYATRAANAQQDLILNMSRTQWARQLAKLSNTGTTQAPAATD